MSQCQFTIPYTETPDDLLKRARELMERKGGNFSGDDQKGEFEITIFGCTITGAYSVVPGDLVINIENKPFFIPCETVEGYLKHKLLA